MNTLSPSLHYIVDPLCGWTYAAAPLMEKSLSIPNLTVNVHGGGMLTGNGCQKISPQWRDFVLPHDKRIEKVSGQPFGEHYFNQLLNDTSIVLDSRLPTLSILAAQSVANKGVIMLNRLQSFYFHKGRNITDANELSQLNSKLVDEIGIAKTAFQWAFNRHSLSIHHHFKQSRKLLTMIGAQGFPSAALQISGRYFPLNLSHYHGLPQQWIDYLNHQLQQHTTFIKETAHENI